VSWWLILGLVLAILAFAKRDAIGARLRRFDEANRRKTARLIAARGRPHAHITFTLEEIADRIPEVEIVQDPNFGERAIWQGRDYIDVESAEAARRQAILEEARSFYQDVDAMLLERVLEARRARERKGLPSNR